MAMEDMRTFRFRVALRWAVLLSVAVLAVTGFGPLLVLGKGVGGYGLLMHVAAGGIFAVGLAGLSVAEAHRNRFCADSVSPSSVLRKACFWTVLPLSVVMFVSVAAGMFQLSGAPGQEQLVIIHRYSAVLIVIAGAVYAYLVYAERMKSR